MRKIKQIALLALAVIFCGTITVSALPQTAAQTETVPAVQAADMREGFELCAETDALQLYVNQSNAAFCVRDKATGKLRYSAPTREEESFASGVYRMEVLSMLVIDYSEKASENNKRVNSQTGSVTRKTFEVKNIKNGYRVTFTFEDLSMVLPVEIVLDNDQLVVTVLSKEMTYDDETFFIDAISVLPYFMVGKDGEQGYILVPDGCGGLINLNNGKSDCATYSRAVFGEDIGGDRQEYLLNIDNEKISFPVYGLNTGDTGIFAIITEGAEMAYVNANPNYKIASMANVYSKFFPFEKMKYSLVGTITIYEKNTKCNSNICVRYSFPSKEDATYSGMAKYYKKYLMETEKLQVSKIQNDPCYLTLYGGVVKPVSRLGIVVDAVVPLTTTEQVTQIAAELKALGVDKTIINYRDWNKQQLLGKRISNMKIAGSLKTGGVSMQDLLEDKNFTLYPTVHNTFQFSKGGMLAKLLYSTSDLSGQMKRMFTYSISVGEKDESKAFSLFTVVKMDKHLNGLWRSAKKSGFDRIGLSDVGNILYDDYRKGSVKRLEMKDVVLSALDSLTESIPEQLYENPNAYAIKYASDIINVPAATSGQNLLDESVPFQQIVLSGLKRYAIAPVNYYEGRVGLLKCLETGSALHYEGYYADSETIKGTYLSNLYIGNYRHFLPELAEYYGVLKQVQAEIKGATIDNHRILSDDVAETTYSNGVVVYVNYGSTEYVADGHVVPAQGYTVAKRGD